MRTGEKNLMCPLKIVSLRALDIFRPCTSSLRCGGRVTRKISNARFRDTIFKLRKGAYIFRIVCYQG
jgi:hypothetical protein